MPIRNLLYRLLTLYSFLLILIASAVLAHPGKTDYQDGHKCLKNCEDWDMNYDEYHLHDKDRNAIRTEGRKKSLKEPASAKRSEPKPLHQEIAAVPVPPAPEPQIQEPRRTVRVDQGYSMPVEAGFVLTLYDFLLLGVAGLLLLIMIVLRRKREKET